MVERSEEYLKAKAEVDAAIKRWVSFIEKEKEQDEPFVIGWAAHAEYISTRTEASHDTHSMVIVPEDQAVAMSLGLFHLGMNAFNIRGREW
jgi:plasmid replication initiation protein